MSKEENQQDHKSNIEYGTAIEVRNGLIVDIVEFFFLPIRGNRNRLDNKYEAIINNASVNRLIALVTIASVFSFLLILFAVSVSHNTMMEVYVSYFPFILGYLLLVTTLFATSTVLQFWVFRAMGGKGSLIKHGYISGLSSVNVFLLITIASLILAITRISLFGNIAYLLGSLVLLYASFISMRVVHKLANSPLIAGFVIATLLSVPLFWLYFYLIELFGRSRPYEYYDWRLTMILSSMIFILILFVSYIFLEQKVNFKYPEITSVFAPLKVIMDSQWLKGFLSIVIVVFIGLLIIFYQLDKFESDLRVDQHPISIATLPNFDPDLIFIISSDHPYGFETQLEIWDFKEQKKVTIIPLNADISRLRPSEDGSMLILSEPRYFDGDALIFDPSTKELTGGTFAYLEDDGILNFYRDDIYYPRRHGRGGIKLVRNGEETILYGDKHYNSVFVHPNKENLFFIGGNFIDVVNAETLEVIETINVGGGIRDLAVSEDGKALYVIDWVWDRVIEIPSPVY